MPRLTCREFMNHKFVNDTVALSFYDRFSHELRTMLTGIVGFAEYIEHTADEPMMKFAAEVINRGGKDVLRITSAYFDLFRLQTGEINLQLSSFNLIDAINDVIQSAREYANLRSVKIVLNADSEAWNVQMIADLSFFKNMLDLIVMDFVHTSSKEDLIQINVTCEGIGDAVKLRFVKTSEIENAKLTRLYQDFWLDEKEMFLHPKQEGPGVCAALAKGFIHGSLGRVLSANVDGNSFFLDVLFPLSIERKL